MPAGRPSDYTQEIADRICQQLASGMSLREVCRSDDMPAESTVRLWALEDRDGFSAQYTRAREIGYHSMADELLEIADDAANDWMERNGDDNEGWQLNGEHVQRSRIRLDTRKWLLSKALPKVYGDKLDHTSSDGSMTPKDSGAAILEALNRKHADT
jgi:hypothetical protein